MGLHLPGLKIKNVSILLGDSSRLGASSFAKLTKSRVDMTSHSMLVILTKKEISGQPVNKHIELKVLEWTQHLKGD